MARCTRPDTDNTSQPTFAGTEQPAQRGLFLVYDLITRTLTGRDAPGRCYTEIVHRLVSHHANNETPRLWETHKPP